MIKPTAPSLSHPHLGINFRSFRPDDGVFCYQLRRESFFTFFVEEIGEAATRAGAQAYQPADFILISQQNACFILEEGQHKLGFFILAEVDPRTAELFLIYLKSDQHGRGLGKACMDYIDQWVTTHWPTVRNIFVDTIIPKYNGGFYEKMGYQKLTDTECQFPEITLPAIRYQKTLR